MLFDWPIGTVDERRAAMTKLPGAWLNSNPFANHYEISPGVWNYHDGVDLNLNTPYWNADWHKGLYAIADGYVIFAGIGGGSWGHIIDIQHYFPEGYIVSRFGHIESPLVKTGDNVVMGQQVASVGNGDGWYGQTGAHLHWNISQTNDPILIDKPNQWCGTSLRCVLDHFVDPIKFIVQRKTWTLPSPEDSDVTSKQMYVNNLAGANFRPTYSTALPVFKLLANKTAVQGYDLLHTANGYSWRLVEYGGNVGWIVDKFLTDTPPV